MRRGAAVLLVLAVAVFGTALPAAGQQGAWWNTVPEENRDLPPGLVAYHEIGPKLREIERRSNRVQVEVIGQSVQGRDLYLVTVSDPRSFGKFGRYKALRNTMLRDPERARRMAAEFEDFKVPFFVNASIHGDEWEGVDASLRLIERLAFSDDPETRKILANTVVLFNVSQNPDGRVLGTRANANGFDVNRDFITLSQPESRLTVEQILEWHPMVFLDLHGYVNPYLIEPATPPHNPNYEYDLYIKWALDQAEAMEEALQREMGLGAVIPFRDWEDGWDDWPPIFTPMYAMYHGAYAHTLESPFRVNRSDVNLPPGERQRRAELNVRSHMTTVWASLLFASENRREMVRDQIEVFRRGWLGEPQVPIGDTYGEQHEFLAEFPEAYVIPAGESQRSLSAAAGLVNHLLDNGIEVERAARPFSAGGETYPAGSYVVRMQQPKRGLANTILEPGWDITEVVPVMYDISAWSHALLWGATVDVIPKGTPLSASTRPVTRHERAQGSVAGGPTPYYELLVNSPAAVRAVNHLLQSGIELQRSDDGRVFVPSAARTEVQRLARDEGLTFAAAAPDAAEPLDAVRVAGAISDEEYFVLTNLGFEVDRISTSVLNGGFQLDEYDVLFVSTGLNYVALNGAARAEVDEFLSSGGGLVARGAVGARFNRDAGVLDVSYATGPSRANGIVRVENAADSPVTSTAPTHGFVYAPLWFTDPGAGVEVSQRFAGGDFFVAGHWTGQENAAGRISAVHGTSAAGGRAVLFGTDPLFRAHPRGLFPQAAHALWWAAN
ncbi:peptidase M28 [Rubrobacter taiwanensis]|jgi:hypothetical protein|uniref:Peptidase M28 n=1 Tax=Rubrobacter taiwanensis TaxID=185139 RepID=A0A4R1B9Q6_9ACTN|nr:M14 family zinc carboxypeptidase [Rubrobacter taiwanensis]TCJ13655.1 peptidase M28 [Rubrobacter taiwanensis]